MTLPLDRFCNFVWWWATSRFEDEQEQAQFEAQLWRPPKGQVVTEGPWSAEAEAAAFAAVKAATTGRASK